MSSDEDGRRANLNTHADQKTIFDIHALNMRYSNLKFSMLICSR